MNNKNDTKELSYKNYKSLLKLNDISFKGGLRWFLCAVLFAVPTTLFSNNISFNNAAFTMALTAFMFMEMYGSYDHFANPPQLVSTAPVSRRKVVKYDMISFLMEIIPFIISLFIVLSILSARFGDSFAKDGKIFHPITKGDIFTLAMPFIFMFLLYPLSYVKSKKRFYIQGGITIAVYMGITALLQVVIHNSPNYVNSDFTERINANFKNIPHNNIILTAAVVLLVISIISAYFLSLKNAEQN